ncbi:MAG: deoxyribose-phosphate aldolase [Dysgonamonadaceae bacterium]|nr:deoxyribose-phosphate aldolase [Dysgonamonadaceae bacterium]
MEQYGFEPEHSHSDVSGSHETASSYPEINRYRETFGKFSSLPTDKDISLIINSLLDKCFKENFTMDVLKQIHGCIDLTTLTSIDTKESVWAMVDNVVNNYEGKLPNVPNIAAICVYPLFVDTVKQALTAQEVKIASVTGGFPSSQTFTEIKIAETAMAVMAGADEIDAVMNLGYFMEEDYETLTDELSEIKDSCRDAKLKVIIETGALAVAENIKKATILAAYSGADFIKTSTGKGYPGATLEAVYIICKVIKEYADISGRKVGVKVSGGIKTAEDAVRYYTIVKEVLGKKWLNRDLFRIGASSLVADIEKRLGE